MTTEEFLSQARKLRSEADAAEHKFLEFLCGGEDQRSIWDGSGLTFPEFLERNNICKAVRYIRYKRVRDEQGSKEIEDVGMEAVVAAGGFTAPDAQRDVLDECRKIESTNGTSTSEQTAERVARDRRQRDAAVRGRHQNYAVLVDQNERLKFEIKRLRDKVVALEAELKGLRAASTTPAPAKPKKAQGRAAS